MTAEARWVDDADPADVPTSAVWTFEGRGRAEPTTLNGRWHIRWASQLDSYVIDDRRPGLPGPVVTGRSWTRRYGATRWLELQLGITADYPPPTLANEPLTLGEAWAVCRRLDEAGEAALRRILPASEVRP